MRTSTCAQKNWKSALLRRWRDMQTELLRGFAVFSQEIRRFGCEKSEVVQSNLDTAISCRVNN